MGICETVTELALPITEELGLELWDVEFKKEGADYYLRIYIDKPDGVSIDDCVTVDGRLSPVLDEVDPIEQSYYLEVSSAGLVRELKKDKHFDRFIGQTVCVHTYKSIDGVLPKKFDAVLRGYDGENIIFEIKGTDTPVARTSISKISIDLV